MLIIDNRYLLYDEVVKTDFKVGCGFLLRKNARKFLCAFQVFDR